MQTRRATELNLHSGEILEQVMTGSPVLITKGKTERPVAVIMSHPWYLQLTKTSSVVEDGQGNVDEASEIGVHIEKTSHLTGTLAASRVPETDPLTGGRS